MAHPPDEMLETTLGQLWYNSHPEERSDERPRNYEEALVEDARYRGATWRQIADALGITEQGARNRYHHLRGSPGRPFQPDS